MAQKGRWEDQDSAIKCFRAEVTQFSSTPFSLFPVSQMVTQNFEGPGKWLEVERTGSMMISFSIYA